MKETIKSAFMQLIGNKLRTFLTMLGMIIGIASVIMILSLGEGMQGFINGQFATIGQGTIMLRTMQTSNEYLMTDEDMEVLESIDQVKSTMKVYPGYSIISKDYYNKDKILMGMGIPHNMQDVTSLNILYGRMISEQDDEMKNNVVIVEDNFSKIMFGHQDGKYALGKTIDLTIGGETHEFEIIAVCKSQYPSAAPTEMIVPMVYIPFSTLDEYAMDGQGKTEMAYVVIEDGYNAADYSKAIAKIIDKRHANDDSYMCSSLAEVSDIANDILGKLNLFTGAVAAVSLLVGGIGIMNIMMVTVKERTREIGIRKALGATDKQILTQFLVEALMITLIGGIIGLILGYWGGSAIASLMDITPQITVFMVTFAVGTSTFIGIVFGVYPAYKASQLDPVEALREE